MLKSMTGYGRAKVATDGLDVTFEIKSVNHRYFDFTLRVNKTYGYIEDAVKKHLQKHINRGKLDVYVGIDIVEGDSVDIKLNTHILEGYLTSLKKISDDYGVTNDISVSSVARYSDIFKVYKPDDDAKLIINAVLKSADAALESYMEMIKTEGSQLEADIVSHLNTVTERAGEIEKIAPTAVAEYQEKLQTRITELAGGITEPQRILTEVAIYSEKLSIDEELVRLKSHAKQFGNMITEGSPIGKKMDFLMQEMNRETNTIGSKSADLEITNHVVEIKSELEKIREQIQNIE